VWYFTDKSTRSARNCKSRDRSRSSDIVRIQEHYARSFLFAWSSTVAFFGASLRGRGSLPNVLCVALWSMLCYFFSSIERCKAQWCANPQRSFCPRFVANMCALCACCRGAMCMAAGVGGTSGSSGRGDVCHVQLRAKCALLDK